MSVRSEFIGDPQSPTVIVADASKMGSELLGATIRRHNEFRVVGFATTHSEAIFSVSKLQPDIAVISSRLRDGAFTGVQVLRELRALKTQPRVIMLLDDDQSELVVESFRNGARGVFCRTEVATQLRKCIRSVYQGQIWASNAQTERIIEAVMRAPAPTLAKMKALSQREEEIAKLVASGLSNIEIADRLLLSRHTVKNYLFRVYEKLGLASRIELVLYILSRYPGTESEQYQVAKITLTTSA